jgi:lipopolysaccharide export system protein LptC
MQYHFIVYFDESDAQWHIMASTDHMMPDGSIYDPENEEYGWMIPDSGSPESLRDAELFQDLRATIGAVIEP